ncbi:MAG: hypothetical protein QG671_3476 [Actinomycetota bacterium]|jgi:hypothetical protein|nr:hypothetical protein [Actinomycetota bacterium]
MALASGACTGLWRDDFQHIQRLRAFEQRTTNCMMNRMTQPEIVQARLTPEDAMRLDDDRKILGLATRSDAVREGLRLLHKTARHAALAQEYDDFYGAGAQAPMGTIAAYGDQVAAESMVAGG